MTTRASLSVCAALALMAAACGSESPTAPSAAKPLLTVAAPLVSAPAPSPVTPIPVPTPSACAACEPPVSSQAPAKLFIYVYFVQDPDGDVVEEADSYPRDYTIHLDATAKDADNKPTNGSGEVRYILERTDLLELLPVSGTTFHVKLKVQKGSGVTYISAMLDGVTSNRIGIRSGT